MDSEATQKETPAYFIPAEKFREVMLVTLFSASYEPLDNNLISIIAREMRVAPKVALKAIDRIKKLVSRQALLDEKIKFHLKNWALDRLQLIDLSILRLSLFELLYEPKVPPKVILTEAKRLAKKFSSDKAARFVYSLLAATMHETGLLPKPGDVEVVEELQEIMSAQEAFEQNESKTVQSQDQLT